MSAPHPPAARRHSTHARGCGAPNSAPGSEGVLERGRQCPRDSLTGLDEALHAELFADFDKSNQQALNTENLMSDKVEQCPTCGGAVEREQTEIGEQLQGDDERRPGRARPRQRGRVRGDRAADAARAPARDRVGDAAVGRASRSSRPRTCATRPSAALDCDGVAKQARARRQFDEAAEWSLLAERHRKRAKRIMMLLSNAEQQMLQQQIHAGPLGEPPRRRSRS
jgi:hypothetical protein